MKFQSVRSYLDHIKQKKELEHKLLEVPYSQIFPYLHLLVETSKILEEAAQSSTRPEQKFVVYLAAAVSDFYVPQSQMAEHKIQSRDSGSGLQINLVPTPKLL